jgi:hypothetical protein
MIRGNFEPSSRCCGHEPVYYGVRPGTGAAAFARTSALEFSKNFFAHNSAAPERPVASWEKDTEEV